MTRARLGSGASLVEHLSDDDGAELVLAFDGPASAMAMSRAVTPGDLRVVFQPIVHLGDGSIFAYEALARCACFESPIDLFHDAVKNAYVGRLGRTLREIAVPLAAGSRLFVNVHPAELDAAWLVRPDDPIYAHDRAVYVEITEAAPLTDARHYRHVLREMRSRGDVHIVIDDLGTGYSNLQWLVDLEPAVVKLDRGLVAETPTSARQRRLVAGVVRICAELGAKVVAEGIETEDELSALVDLGADYGQGYFFARPAYPLPTVGALASLPVVLPPRALRAS